uniref:Uncharacterized protein n=1 Tax=Oryza barthii TaxID=65489 RepID=A0A0D3EJJ2_9ORYZ
MPVSARGEEAAGKPANSRGEGGGWEASEGTGRRREGGGLGCRRAPPSPSPKTETHSGEAGTEAPRPPSGSRALTSWPSHSSSLLPIALLLVGCRLPSFSSSATPATPIDSAATALRSQISLRN